MVLCRYVGKDKRDETGAREERNIHCQCATFTVRGQGKKGPESGKHLPPIPTLNTHIHIYARSRLRQRVLRGNFYVFFFCW